MAVMCPECGSTNIFYGDEVDESKGEQPCETFCELCGYILAPAPVEASVTINTLNSLEALGQIKRILSSISLNKDWHEAVDHPDADKDLGSDLREACCYVRDVERKLKAIYLT